MLIDNTEFLTFFLQPQLLGHQIYTFSNFILN